MILIATGNRGKLREIQAVLSGIRVVLKTLADFPGIKEAIEDGDTFAENAAKKARHYSRLTGLRTLADDSGLEVDALGGAPGVHSARYAGDGADDSANNRKLVSAIAGVDPPLRTARFRCAIAVADGDTIEATAEGSVDGRIIDDPRGENGFGYDPHFWIPEHGMTAAQMSPSLKNAISHRGRALEAIRPSLVRLLGGRGC